MENGCGKTHENVYRACRKRAAVNNDALASMEKAAEQLGISVSSLNQYELGITKNVPVDMVVLMADVYKAPELRNYYCRQECPIGKNLPLATQADSLSAVVVRIIQCMDEDLVKDIKKKLVDIASDGHIDASEQHEFHQIIDRLQVLSEQVSQLKIIAEKGE